MKLPDFTNDKGLLALRQSMGAGAPGDFWPGFRPEALSILELEQLATEGKEVSIGEIQTLDDGTLRYKDSRVLVYIRDVSAYGLHFSEPRYHIADCRTLQQMREQNRFGRYVVATRDDGLFLVNRIGRFSKATGENMRLNVCQNCLNRLNFEGFSYFLSQTQRSRIVSNFTIRKFFSLYARSLFARPPHDRADTAPINDYTPLFNEIAAYFKERQRWRCQICDLDLSDPDDRKYLHVHHLNGLKSDNSDENLRALCLECHSRQPRHMHMRNLAEYARFLRRFRSR